jgi:hypothetical protein
MRLRISLALALLGSSAPCSADQSVFAANEVRTANVKDRLRGIKAALKDGSEGAKRHSAAITEAFKDTGDWAVATEAYYARKGDLVARATALEARFDDLISRNAPERAEKVSKSLEEAGKHEAVLRSDYEFYMKLPKLAEGPQRHAAQAAMRLLGSTGDYPVSLAYFLDKTPNRPPFAPLPPGVMAIRHQDAGATPSR